jgi:16S rRNA G966 N2-methylase RsmD
MLETVKNDPLIAEIQAIQKGQSLDYWSFKNATRRKGAHALIHYPAMMVPSLQGKLLDAIKKASPTSSEILDPFVGSGTILVEAMCRGFNFTGLDINPLAALACLAKSGPYYVDEFELKCFQVCSTIRADRGRKHYVKFENQQKWFDDEISRMISRVARGIESEQSLWARRLFWLALAKVVRTSCNSRMSTYKLHIRKDLKIERADPIDVFESVLDGFLANLRQQYEAWSATNLLQSGRYRQSVQVKLGDSRTLLSEKGLVEKFDIVMTSPPYGDNTTTIPYGQYSYLPLKWIQLNDIADDIDPILLANAYAVDSASLGGSKRKATERGSELMLNYESARTFSKTMSVNSNEFKRFASFFADLDDCAEKIANVTKSGGYQTWTIGNRCIGGQRVPMEKILGEMLERRGVETIGHIRRTIHAKKMATRNSVSATMSQETILLARKVC